jgi:hypothetical protein
VLEQQRAGIFPHRRSGRFPQRFHHGHQAQCEVEAFHQFRELSGELLEANEKIQSGMFWTVDHENANVSLRCCHRNSRFEDIAPPAT